MSHEFQYLFTPIRVGSLTLKNRIFSTGHAEAMAEGEKPTERLWRYHEGKARGGFALTIIGGSTSVHPSSPAAAWNLIANHDDSVIPAYRKLAEAIHSHDCLVFTQLTHLGRRAHSDAETWHVLIDQFWSPLFNQRSDEYGELHDAGDCVAPRGVHPAILDGTRVARAI